MGFAASGGNATKQLAAVRGVGPRRVSSSRRRHRRDPRGLAPPWGTGMRRGSRQTQRPASEPPGPTVAADDAPTSCLGDNGTASLPWALSTATCSAQVRRPASRPSCPSFPTPSQPQRPTPRCRQICAGTTSSCSNFPGGSVHFRPFPLEKISPAPGNRIHPALHRERRGRQRAEGARGQRTPVPDKAGRGRILGIFDRGATQSGGMHRRSNAAGTFATGCQGEPLASCHGGRR